MSSLEILSWKMSFVESCSPVFKVPLFLPPSAKIELAGEVAATLHTYDDDDDVSPKQNIRRAILEISNLDSNTDADFGAGTRHESKFRLMVVKIFDE